MKAEAREMLRNRLGYVDTVRAVRNLMKAEVFMRWFIGLGRIDQFKLAETLIAKVDIVDEERAN